MLAEGHDIEPDLLSPKRDLDLGLDALVLRGGSTGGGVGGDVTDAEDAELHGPLQGA